MVDFLNRLGLFLPWGIPLGMIVAINLLVALSKRQWGRERWVLATVVVLTPLAYPEAGTENRAHWGVLSTLLTTLAIVTTARLVDVNRHRAEGSASCLDVFLWMSLPMVKAFPRGEEERAANRARALAYFKTGSFKLLVCTPFIALTHLMPGVGVPWIVKSSVLILHFVLCLTASADLLNSMCLACGVSIDRLFEAPLLSVSPREFWGTRWNRFISRFALKHVALPLGRARPTLVVLMVFFISGVFHEYFAWGVGGSAARLGFMSLFFLAQGMIVWGGDRLWPSRSPWLGRLLTFGWMSFSAPLFFLAIEVPLLAFGYPESWLPTGALWPF